MKLFERLQQQENTESKLPEEVLQTAGTDRFDEIVRAFDAACKSDELKHYRLYLRIHSKAEGEKTAKVYSISVNTPRVSIINNTISFHWRKAAFIFLQEDGSRKACKQVADAGHLYGVSLGEWSENYKMHKERAEKKNGKSE